MWSVECIDYMWSIVDSNYNIIATVNEFVEKARLICEKHNIEVKRIYENQN